MQATKTLQGPQELTTLPGWAADYPCQHNRCKAWFGGHPDHHGKCEATHDTWGFPFGDPNRPHFGGDCNTPWCEKHAGVWTGWQEYRDWRESVLGGDKTSA